MPVVRRARSRWCVGHAAGGASGTEPVLPPVRRRTVFPRPPREPREDLRQPVGGLDTLRGVLTELDVVDHRIEMACDRNLLGDRPHLVDSGRRRHVSSR